MVKSKAQPAKAKTTTIVLDEETTTALRAVRDHMEVQLSFRPSLVAVVRSLVKRAEGQIPARRTDSAGE